ncbi:MAG: DEAD/DEAH box helicase [Acidobacteria bacterium]|uniref:DEAD-box ATP-dependent RNA helicase RhpA n=1 Tax=Candidatus Polarisedimenticola svalbardensis TaxID=2886004 RepID=A0A8J7CCK8_9BACT|nr:DEAD/DEAH box helicase [Candidatus Polarisedimenticola svalbardensis]
MHDSKQESGTGFNAFDLGPSIQRGIAAAGFTEPRPIQDQAIPAALEGRDILGLAQTGTGKTAAFALPVLERLLSRRGGHDPRVLIVAPTRELATQIGEEIRSLARFTRIKVATVFGGVSINAQTTELRNRPEIVVACPGRLLDLLGRNALRLDSVESLVLDEADHMFDMGFLPDIRRIVAALPEKRQNLLFSATMPKEIRRLADRLLENPHVVELNHTQQLETIEHALYPVDETRKYDMLEHVLSGDDFRSAIVFTRTKHRAKRLAQKLDKSGHRAVALQGNMSQNARVRAMDGFRKREYDVLVATDIAARGIDVDQVTHVVNYDMPNTSDAYTHRIGRTGRSERDGKAYTFVTTEDGQMVREVERRIGSAIPRRKVEGMDIPVRQSGRPSRSPSRSSRPHRRRAS